ncbi:MAG: 23S rRNA (adenine(2503)-C(2))-methyltransferase RlmN [Candidatus Omnitrophota bacterium]
MTAHPTIPRDIRDLSYQELQDYLVAKNERTFRATQIFEWIYKKNAKMFDEITSCPAGLRQELKNDFVFRPVAINRKDVSRDGTVKFLFDLPDHQKIETVMIPASSRMTVCVSTQVGCKFACQFCASGLGGFKRNLTCAEIVGQVLAVQSFQKKQNVTHVVFMGVGEPLDNYDNLMKAIRLLNSSYACALGARRMTISTCGLIPQIKRLSKENIQVELSISLHASNDEVRNRLMPINRRYPLGELMKACRLFTQETKRQITFEYLLIRDLTCTKQAVAELCRLLKGIIAKLNLIVCNEVSVFALEPPRKLEILVFQQELRKMGIHATLRQPRGRDIHAACGQLKYFAEKEN